MGNECFHGHSKLFIDYNETVKRCYSSVVKLYIHEMIGRELNIIQNIKRMVGQYKNLNL